jgi:hypothetical protein
MSDASLLKQLANRTKDWHRNTGITQAAMAAKLNIGRGQLLQIPLDRTKYRSRSYLLAA